MNTETYDVRTASDASVWISDLDILAGIWLIIAPFVLLYGSGRARVNDIVLAYAGRARTNDIIIGILVFLSEKNAPMAVG